MKVGFIDLTIADVAIKYLDSRMIKTFLGGLGTSLRIACDLIKPGISPLSPENLIIIGAGPLVGTRIQAPRWTVVTKLPLGETVGVNIGGAGFGVQFKYAGWDHLVISGRSPKPVYIKIFDNDIEICDATHLWGKDIFESSDALSDKYGNAYSIVAIGQAGENLVKSSIALIDKMSTLGKGGLAAVMGSKNLKAIVVNGTAKRTQIFNKPRFDKACGEVLSQIKADHKEKVGKKTADDFPPPNLHKNYTEIYPKEKYQELYGTGAHFNKIRGRGCRTCAYPCPCKYVLEVNHGKLMGLTTNLSSFGRVEQLGIQCSGGCSSEEVVKLVDTAQRYGIDVQIFAPAMEMILDLYEQDIITAKEMGYVIPKRDFTTTLLLLEMTASGQGIGKILGDGSFGIIKRFGRESEKFSTHNKGVDEVIDPRLSNFGPHAFAQVVSPGGRHMGGMACKDLYPNAKGFSLDKVRRYCERMEIPKQAIDRIFDVPTGYNAARLTRYAEDFYIVLSSLGICHFRTDFYSWENLAELYFSATGIEMTVNELKQCGERILNLWKVINFKEGFTRKDDRFSEKWLEPLRTGDGQELPLKGCGGDIINIDILNKMLDDYYDERGWDIMTGVPTRDKLITLGLENIVANYDF